MARPRKKALVTWKEKALEKAKARNAIRPSGGDSSIISIRGGVFTFGEVSLPEELKVIVLDEAAENSRFKKKYVEGEYQAPMCYAISEPLSLADSTFIKNMAPHEKAEEPQSKTCSTCEWNEFGSASDGGKGKGCGNRRRLLLIAADNLDNIENAMVALLKVPPTGLKRWDAYANWLYRIEAVTPEYVITNVSLKKVRPTDIAPLPQFELIGHLPDEICEKVDELVERHRHILLQPFPDDVPEPAPTRTRRTTKKRAVRR